MFEVIGDICNFTELKYGWTLFFAKKSNCELLCKWLLNTGLPIVVNWQVLHVKNFSVLQQHLCLVDGLVHITWLLCRHVVNPSSVSKTYLSCNWRLCICKTKFRDSLTLKKKNAIKWLVSVASRRGLGSKDTSRRVIAVSDRYGLLTRDTDRNRVTAGDGCGLDGSSTS